MRFKHMIQKLLNLSSRKCDSKKTAGPFFEKSEYPKHNKEKLIVLFGVLVFGVLTVLATSHVYTNYKHNQDIKKLGGVKPTTQIATAKQEEKRYSKVDKQNLEAGDIESYQITKLSLVNSYFLQRDYKGASRVLGDIKDNIPAEKLNPTYYV